MSDLIVHERPELRSPRLVAAFAGWPDAAETATRAASILRDRLGARRFAELQSEDFHSLTTTRPLTVIRDGRIRALRFPSTDFHYWRNPTVPQDLIFVVGVEPDLQWRRYVGAILDLAQEQGVVAIYVLGGLYDNVPHTRPVRVSAVVEDSALRQRLAEAGIVFSDYEGPCAVHTALLYGSRARRIPSASLWGHAPAYARLSWNPKVTDALLRILTSILEVEADLTELRAAARWLAAALDRLAAQNPQMGTLIRQLEQDYGPSEGERPAQPPEVSESILREVEEILRRHEGAPEDKDGGQGDEPGDLG